MAKRESPKRAVSAKGPRGKAAQGSSPASGSKPTEPLEPEVLPPDELDEPGGSGLGAGVPSSEAIERVKSGSLAPRDALRSYMAEVSRHPVLSREEQDALAWRYFKDPGSNVDAAYRLVTANLRLVVKLAYQYRRAAFNVLDLIQEGNIGLMQAVKKFDPQRGIKLSSYAAWWIRAYILRYIMDNFRMVKLGTTEAQRKLFFNLRKEQEKLASQGIAPAPKLLAERLNVSERDVEEMQTRMGNEELSLDAPVGRGDGEQRQTGIDRLPSDTPALDDALADAEIKGQFHDHLQEFGATLTGKEKTIFEERMIAEQPLTLQEIGDKFGLTRERVRQLESQLTKRLRESMAKNLPEFQELSLAKPKE
jgi:RNA polymerase sigma-32 factor